MKKVLAKKLLMKVVKEKAAASSDKKETNFPINVANKKKYQAVIP